MRVLEGQRAPELVVLLVERAAGHENPDHEAQLSAQTRPCTGAPCFVTVHRADIGQLLLVAPLPVADR